MAKLSWISNTSCGNVYLLIFSMTTTAMFKRLQTRAALMTMYRMTQDARYCGFIIIYVLLLFAALNSQQRINKVVSQGKTPWETWQILQSEVAWLLSQQHKEPPYIIDSKYAIDRQCHSNVEETMFILQLESPDERGGSVGESIKINTELKEIKCRIEEAGGGTDTLQEQISPTVVDNEK